MCLVLLICTLTIWSSMLCVLMLESMYVVVNGMLSLMIVMSPHHSSCNLSMRTVVKLSMNKQFELLEFVLHSVYVDQKYNEIYLTFTAGSVDLCGVCSHMMILVFVIFCTGIRATTSLLDDNTEEIIKVCILLACLVMLFPEFPISFPFWYIS